MMSVYTDEKNIVMNHLEVTILIASYNPKWSKLQQTVESAILQKDIVHEIIVCDDGSQEKYFTQLISLFEKHNFKRYKLSGANKNEGTCKNVFRGLNNAEGSFVKLISPGDYFHNDTVLREWVDFLRKHGGKVCFGDAVYYETKADGSTGLVSVKQSPQNTQIYDPRFFSVRKAKLNYILLNDAILGANFLADTELMKTYLQLALGHIKYAEDMVYRMMLAEGERIIHYPAPVIYYEYGTGISSGASSRWAVIIENERMQIHELMSRRNVCFGIEKLRWDMALKLLRYPRYQWMKFLVFPELLYWKIKKDALCRYTTDGVTAEETDEKTKTLCNSGR